MKGFSEQSEPALVWTGKVMLEGRVAVPPQSQGTVLFASAPALADEVRDAQIIRELYDSQIATVYVPLLTEDELQFDSRTGHFRYDAEFLAQRFVDVAQWITRNRRTSGVPIGYLGSSGGAAGAIVAAAMRPDLVAGVVAIDGRTDLAIDYLKRLTAPTLLVVKDMPVLRMNREALSKIRGERRIEIVHGVDCHAVECVVQKSTHWLQEKLTLVAADAAGMV
jgi:putative phosphoribosyl transferase